MRLCGRGAGGATGVTVLLRVTEKCKQARLQKDSCAPAWKEATMAEIYFTSKSHQGLEHHVVFSFM